jgi:hypothetical protein
MEVNTKRQKLEKRGLRGRIPQPQETTASIVRRRSIAFSVFFY